MEAIRPKKAGVPDFSKQVGREEEKHFDDGEIYVGDLPEEPIPNDPSTKRPITYNFGKGPERFDIEEKKMAEDLDFGDGELVLNPALLERKIKGAVTMHTGERFPQKLNQDPLYDDLPLNELDNDILGALQATKPKVNVPDFNRY